MSPSAPVIIVGAGLAGLVAAFELSKRQVPTLILDQEPEASLGGQAFWSLGGLFVVDSAEQRRGGVKDSRALAMADWMNSAQFDREREDVWPRRWAKAFVDFAADEMEQYVKDRGLRFMPTPGWAERGDGRANGHGNSVPRFHLTWGTGPEVVRVFLEPVKEAAKKGLIKFEFRHRVDELIRDGDRIVGVRGAVLEPSDVARGVSSSRRETGTFEFRGCAVLVSSGGIGGNVAKVKEKWPTDRFGPRVPESFVIGVPAHVDGRMLDISRAAGASVINEDRMWLYTEGLSNWNPIWPDHGIRVLPGPSSLWLDATGKRLPPALFPGADTLGTLRHIVSTGYDYTWMILDQTIIAREFALSGSEQNPDLTGKSWWGVLRQRILSSGGTEPVQAFMRHGQDFVVCDTLEELVAGMNELATSVKGPQLNLADIRETIDLLNAQHANDFTKDAQLMLVKNARNYRPDSWLRVAKVHPLGVDPKKWGPLIAVRMRLVTRKSLGGLETDLQSRVLRSHHHHHQQQQQQQQQPPQSQSNTGTNTSEAESTPVPGLYAAGEVAGFGGGGVHGYNSLEGTFLGGCIFSGRAAGRAMADEWHSNNNNNNSSSSSSSSAQGNLNKGPSHRAKL